MSVSGKQLGAGGVSSTTVPHSPRRSPVEIAIDRVWRFFCSVRAAIAEIAFLAVLVLIGTLRGSEVPQWIANSIPSLQGFVDRWYAWDVFRSPIFAATLALIAVAIAVCTINRVPGIWQTISTPRVRTSRGYLRRSETAATFGAESGTSDLATRFADALRTRRYRVLTEEIDDETHIYADRNRYSKLGTFPFHLALILLLAGGIVGATYGFREAEFIIPVGDTREVGHGTGLSVELLSFSDTYTPLGIAESFESEILIYEHGEPVKQVVINPNNPTSYRNVTFYQASFGYGAIMLVSDDAGETLFHGTVDLGIFNFAGNPDAPAGFVDVPGTGMVMTVVGPDILPLNQPELDTLNLLHGQMYVILEPRGAEADAREAQVLDQGVPSTFGGYTIEFQREHQWSLLQVGYNPGIPIFIIASFFLLGGLAVTFYMPLRRIRAIAAATENGSELVAVPLARRDWSGKRDFVRVMEETAHRAGLAAEIQREAEPGDWDAVPRAQARAKTQQVE